MPLECHKPPYLNGAYLGNGENFVENSTRECDSSRGILGGLMIVQAQIMVNYLRFFYDNVWYVEIKVYICSVGIKPLEAAREVANLSR